MTIAKTITGQCFELLDRLSNHRNISSSTVLPTQPIEVTIGNLVGYRIVDFKHLEFKLLVAATNPSALKEFISSSAAAALLLSHAIGSMDRLLVYLHENQGVLYVPEWRVREIPAMVIILNRLAAFTTGIYSRDFGVHLRSSEICFHYSEQELINFWNAVFPDEGILSAKPYLAEYPTVTVC
mgnify:FL=1